MHMGGQRWDGRVGRGGRQVSARLVLGRARGGGDLDVLVLKASCPPEWKARSVLVTFLGR